MDCQLTEDIFEAVKVAHKIAKEDDLVLFSPACKSFDQFINYEHRGKMFKQAVNQLVA